MGGHIYAVSDLHGQFDAFISGLEKIHFTSDDFLYVIGDAIDRGSDGIKILQYLMQQENMDLILGNHEFMMLHSICSKDSEWCSGESSSLWILSNGGEPTCRDFFRLSQIEQKALLRWLRTRCLIKTLEIEGQVFCLTHSWYLQSIENKSFCEVDYQDAYTVVWDSVYRGDCCSSKFIYENYDYTFITGHVPVQRASGNVHLCAPFVKRNLVNIDGGCTFGDYPGISNGIIFYELGTGNSVVSVIDKVGKSKMLSEVNDG